MKIADVWHSCVFMFSELSM